MIVKVELFANNTARVIYGALRAVGEDGHFFAWDIEAHKGTNPNFMRRKTRGERS